GGEHAERVLDGVAALDPDEDRDLAVPLRLADARGGIREGEVGGMRLDEPVDQVDELERLHRRAARLRELAADVGGEEGACQSALAPARDVDVAGGDAGAEVHPLLLELLGDVLVGVDDDRAPMQAHRALVEVVGAGGRRQREEAENRGGPPHASFSGRGRRRWPVAANTALATAGAIGGVPGSPAPPAFSPLETMWTSTFGIASSRSTR